MFVWHDALLQSAYPLREFCKTVLRFFKSLTNILHKQAKYEKLMEDMKNAQEGWLIEVVTAPGAFKFMISIGA
jgi:hypothetical protein